MTTEEIKKDLEKKFVMYATMNKVFGLTYADKSKPFNELFATNGVIATILYVVAVVMSLRNQLFDKWKEEITALYESSRYGTWAWWIETAKRWQKGYDTVVIDGEVGYEEINEESQIVKAVMVRQNGRSISIYVAKEEGGELVALDEEELNQFQQYCNNVKPLGVYVVAISKEADDINIDAEVVYNGELSQDSINSLVEEKLNAYFSNLEFGATVYKSQVIEEIMSIEGVVDVELRRLIAIADGVENEIERSWVLSAGYGRVENMTLNCVADSSVRR